MDHRTELQDHTNYLLHSKWRLLCIHFRSSYACHVGIMIFFFG